MISILFLCLSLLFVTSRAIIANSNNDKELYDFRERLYIINDTDARPGTTVTWEFVHTLRLRPMENPLQKGLHIPIDLHFFPKRWYDLIVDHDLHTLVAGVSSGGASGPDSWVTAASEFAEPYEWELSNAFPDGSFARATFFEPLKGPLRQTEGRRNGAVGNVNGFGTAVPSHLLPHWNGILQSLNAIFCTTFAGTSGQQTPVGGGSISSGVKREWYTYRELGGGARVPHSNGFGSLPIRISDPIILSSPAKYCSAALSSLLLTATPCQRMGGLGILLLPSAFFSSDSQHLSVSLKREIRAYNNTTAQTSGHIVVAPDANIKFFGQEQQRNQSLSKAGLLQSSSKPLFETHLTVKTVFRAQYPSFERAERAFRKTKEHCFNTSQSAIVTDRWKAEIAVWPSGTDHDGSDASEDSGKATRTVYPPISDYPLAMYMRGEAYTTDTARDTGALEVLRVMDVVATDPREFSCVWKTLEGVKETYEEATKKENPSSASHASAVVLLSIASRNKQPTMDEAITTLPLSHSDQILSSMQRNRTQTTLGNGMQLQKIFTNKKEVAALQIPPAFLRYYDWHDLWSFAHNLASNVDPIPDSAKNNSFPDPNLSTPEGNDVKRRLLHEFGHLDLETFVQCFFIQRQAGAGPAATGIGSIALQVALSDECDSHWFLQTLIRISSDPDFLFAEATRGARELPFLEIEEILPWFVSPLERTYEAAAASDFRMKLFSQSRLVDDHDLRWDMLGKLTAKTGWNNRQSPAHAVFAVGGDEGDSYPTRVVHAIPFSVLLNTFLEITGTDKSIIEYLRTSIKRRKVVSESITAPEQVGLYSTKDIVFDLPVRFALRQNAKFLLSYRYTTRFLHADLHPPDAMNGMSIPSARARITFIWTDQSASNLTSAINENLRVHKGIRAGEVKTVTESSAASEDEFSSNDSYIWYNPGDCFSSSGVRCAVFEKYFSPLTIHLVVPDFSMVYNVITLVSTVVAFISGSIINATTRRWMGRSRDKAARLRSRDERRKEKLKDKALT